MDSLIIPLHIVLISLIYSYVSYKEPWEKRGENKKILGGKQNEN